CKVAQVLGRNWLGIDINPEYIAMSQKRINTAPPFISFDSIDPRFERVPKDIPQQKTAAQEMQQSTFLLEETS
ncbi:MAG: site-specific DNA-methyltransferase, partial [Chloroflexota bacterium]|nr:site-specific DNA-methyltransferase [Chloroflexota bacterium]